MVSVGSKFDLSLSQLHNKGVILISRNGGNTWSKFVFEEVNGFNDIHFVNAATGFVTGNMNANPNDAMGAVYKTTNGGLNWFPANIDCRFSFLPENHILKR